MKKGTFSIILVPHDLKKTRTFRVPYWLCYIFLTLLVIGVLVMIVFMATYGRLLLKARESFMLENQVTELTKRTEQLGELRRNIARLQAMNTQIRSMLGVDADSEVGIGGEGAGESAAPRNEELSTEQLQIMRSIPTFWPVRGYITKGFKTSGLENEPSYHPGLDIAVQRGTPVRASAPGYVLEAGWDQIYGYYVIIDHGYGMKTLYGHSDRLVVIRGERVGRGQTVAYSGNTGKSTAPHLHFEVRQDNIAVDPLKFLLE